MEKILHPVSGEKGYFCTELEREIINTIVDDWSLRSSECGERNG